MSDQIEYVATGYLYHAGVDYTAGDKVKFGEDELHIAESLLSSGAVFDPADRALGGEVVGPLNAEPDSPELFVSGAREISNNRDGIGDPE
jgi:hypothetical protein